MAGEAASFVGSIPEFYDKGLGPVIFADMAVEMAQRVAALTPSHVLETAAGTGIVTREMRNRLPRTCRLVATDLNPPMLEVARAKFASGEAVEFQPADAMALPFPDASFDALVCQFGVMFFPDKDRAYREVHRVLRPGGRYLLSVWDAQKYNPFALLAHEVAGTFFPSDPPQFYKVPFAYHQIDAIKESLIGAGFERARFDVIGFSKTVTSFEAFANGIVYGNPLIDQIRARGGVEPERVALAVIAALRSRFGAEPVAMPLQAIMIEATRP